MFKRILALMMLGAFLATIAIGCGDDKDKDDAEKEVKDTAEKGEKEIERKGSGTR